MLTFRRRSFAFLPLALLVAACTHSGSSPRDVVEYDARAIYDTVAISNASFSPDGSKILFNSDQSGVFNAYAIPSEGGAPVALTDSTTDAIVGVSYFPRDERILFERDQGGNELDHVFVREVDGGVRDLTPGEKHKAGFVGWSGDERSFYVMSNERDPQFFDLYRYAADGYARELFFQNDGGYSIGDVSLDGRWVALSKEHTNSNDDLLLWDAAHPDQAPVVVTPHEGDVSHGGATFSADSRELYYLSDESSEFNRLWARALAGGEKRLVLEAPWDIAFVSFSRDGRFRVTGTNADARTEITVFDLRAQEPVALPALPDVDITTVEISSDGRRLAFHASGDTSPSNLFAMDLQSGRHRQLTDNLSPAIDERDLVRAQSIRFASFDGLEIPALLYRPHRASETERVPATLWMHGGPGGQSRHGYNPVVQHLVNHGVAVLAVNNRGSSGYGKTFFHLDDQKHGEVDLDDCVWGKRYLESLAWVDADAIGILGGSYGGYLVAAALAFRPEEFAFGVDLFGVTNWLRTLESIPPWWGSFRDSLIAELGDPVADKERLVRISPLFHADKIRRPLLVVQGANDPRVLQVESDEIVAAARKNGVPVEYVVFPDEGHGFVNKENRITAAEAYLRFIQQHTGAVAP